MAKLNVTQAAKAVGITRQTMHEHLKSKGISFERDSRGHPKIDTSELPRVYGSLQEGDSKPERQTIHKLTPANDRQTDTLQAEVDRLKQENSSWKERAERAELEADRWYAQSERLSLALAHIRPEPAPLDPATTPPGRIETPGELVEVEAAKLDPKPAAETSIAGAGKGVGKRSLWDVLTGRGKA